VIRMLYYPLVTPPPDVLAQGILYWDAVGSMAPYEYQPSPELMMLSAEGLFEMIQPNYLPGRRVDDVAAEIEELLDRLSIEQLAIPEGPLTGYTRLYRGKLPERIEVQLVDYGVLKDEQDVFRASGELLAPILATLARAIADEARGNSASDRWVCHTNFAQAYLAAYSAGDHTQNDPAWRLNLGELFPSPTPDTNLADLVKFLAQGFPADLGAVLVDERERRGPSVVAVQLGELGRHDHVAVALTHDHPSGRDQVESRSLGRGRRTAELGHDQLRERRHDLGSAQRRPLEHFVNAASAVVRTAAEEVEVERDPRLLRRDGEGAQIFLERLEFDDGPRPPVARHEPRVGVGVAKLADCTSDPGLLVGRRRDVDRHSSERSRVMGDQLVCRRFEPAGDATSSRPARGRNIAGGPASIWAIGRTHGAYPGSVQAPLRGLDCLTHCLLDEVPRGRLTAVLPAVARAPVPLDPPSTSGVQGGPISHSRDFGAI
jgi:hypothetical protein